MNVEEGITKLIDQYHERKGEIIVGLSLWTIFFTILFYLCQIEVINLEEWKFQTPDILTSVITMFTGLFLHRDIVHLIVNIIGFILFMILFVLLTQKSVLKTSIWFIFI